MALVPLFFIIAVHCIYFSFFFVKPDAVVATYKQVWPPLGTLEALFISWAFKCGMAGVCLATGEA